MEKSYNLRSPAVKRLMREAQELNASTKEYSAKPLDDNLFEWHFTFRGPEDSDFEGGFYHGRIILPPEYPMKPPSIMLLNPNGRFELNKKICLSISGYHPESWQPSWSIRTAILAIIAFMPSKGEGAIGALDYTPEERKALAKKSQTYSCSSCGPISNLLSKETTSNEASPSDEKDRELAKQIVFNKPKQPVKTTPESNIGQSGNEKPADSETTVRQRRPSDRSAAPGARQNPPVRRAEESLQRSDDSTSLVIIVVLVVAISLLLLRRFSMTFDLTRAFM